MTSIDSLYKQLRKLVADPYCIIIKDTDYRRCASIAIKPVQTSHPWTHFYGKTIKQAFTKAIDKLEHPNKDYVDIDGHVWEAQDSSIYDVKHIQQFLKQEILGE